ncbi:MAG: hypothetical protein ACT4P7_13970 [Gemmatimonadaceae bacterium]
MMRPLLLLVLMVPACGRTRSSDAQPPIAVAAPTLASLQPDTIALGQQAVPTLIIRGSGFVPGDGGPGGFASGGNTVRVGPAVVEGVASDAGGRTLRFALALTYTDTTATGRPAAFLPGRYAVTVVTPKGTSNALTLTMIR